MRPIECDVPPGSAVGRGQMSAATFRDSWRVPLDQRDAGVVDIYFSIFGHRPGWMKCLLIGRNRIARLFGLETASEAEIQSSERKGSYRVGDRIGAWPIFSLDETELIAGRDNRHLDFRVSVMKIEDGQGAAAVLSTLCRVHNTSGRCYLFLIKPFHRLGVQYLLSSALAAQRL
jgi:hypothetical protein